MKLILLGLWMWSVIVHAFDPTKVDYCKRNCTDDDGNPVQHIACGCMLAEGRTEILDDMMTFRKKMIHTHNELRNKIASGGEYHLFGFPHAANMKAISYDMELEYVARCVARTYIARQKTCFKPPGYHIVKTNFFYSPQKQMDADPATGWYSGINTIKGDKEEFLSNYSDANSDQKMFIHIVWANTSVMGCARIWVEHKRFEIVCHYADKEGMGRWNKATIYKVGKPCSDCSVGCNKNYPALCGESTIPTDAPYDMKDDETTTSSTDDDDVPTPTPEVTTSSTDEDDVLTPTPEVDNVTTTKSEVITAPSHYNYTTPNHHNKTKRNRTDGKDDDYDYGYDGLDDDDKPRISITAHITTNIALVFVGTIVIRWFK